MLLVDLHAVPLQADTFGLLDVRNRYHRTVLVLDLQRLADLQDAIRLALAGHLALRIV